MAASPVLALELLFDAVSQRFAAEGPAGVSQVFGWRHLAQHHGGARIVWVPGDPSGAVGSSYPARNPGGDPRSLETLREQFYVVVSAADPEAPEDERLQYRATRLLRDYWFRAVYHAAHGTFAIDREEWLLAKLERRYGAAIRLTGWIEAKVPDVAPAGLDYTLVDGAAADLTVSELELDETLTVSDA